MTDRETDFINRLYPAQGTVMSNKDIIKIKSKKHSEHSSKIEQDGKTYYIITELTKDAPLVIRSTVYLDGAHIETDKVTFGKTEGSDVAGLIDEQHRKTVEKIKKKNLTSRKRVRYFRDIKSLIKKNEFRDAMELTQKAFSEFPDDPYVMSYYGYLLALSDRNHEEGIRNCLEAIKKLEMSIPFGADFFYPFFYLNLSRTYLDAGMKTEAIGSLRKGISYDGNNHEIIAELQKLGVRKRPVIPFLSRSNPVNKIGRAHV